MKNSLKRKDQYSHTSVSLSPGHIELLIKTATDNNLSVNSLMILLLRYVHDHPIINKQKTKHVKYQNDGINAQIMNLYIGDRDYEKNMDSRRFGRVSISFLLAYAIENYLDIILKKTIDGVAKGIEVLTNYDRETTVVIKKKRKKIKMVSIWYPMRT